MKLSDCRPVAYSYPDQLNLFTGNQELSSTFSTDYGKHSKVGVDKAYPTDCISFSSDKLENSTTEKDAYRPYSGKNYVPTAAARVPTSNGSLSTVKTTKAIHIPARPKTQMGISSDKLENMTSYSYQFSGEKSERSEPYRPSSEMEGPSGEQSFESTNQDYKKTNYGRPLINRIPDSGLFAKTSHGDGTTNSNHFGAPPPTKEPNLRPKTSVLLGTESFVPKSCYTKSFNGISKLYAV